MSQSTDPNVLQPPPVHHVVHNSSDPLPTRSVDYAQQATDGAGEDVRSTTATVGSHTAFNEQRPLDTQPAPEGGVARGGNEGLPEGKASITDKLVGKTEKVIGKAKKDPELLEKGELREAGGKAAVAGEARAPHD